MTARARTTLAAAGAMLVLGATPARAHRLDEYLQATMISVAKDRVRAQIRLTPGVAVFPRVLAGIDANRDGVISPTEQRTYAERVLREVSLAVDGTRVPLRLVAATFASTDAMRAGRGDILIDFDAAVPRGAGDRQLTFENRHQRPIGVYLVNALVPRDPDVRITAQRRNDEQSFYRLEYAQAGAPLGPLVGPLAPAWWSGARGWLGAAALLPLAWLALSRQRRAEVANETVSPG